LWTNIVFTGFRVGGNSSMELTVISPNIVMAKERGIGVADKYNKSG
jgi:hypothetical protein